MFAQRQRQTLEQKYLEDPSWPLSKPIPMPEGPIRPPETDEATVPDTEVPPPPGADVPATAPRVTQRDARDAPISRPPASPTFHLQGSATRILRGWCEFITKLAGQPVVLHWKRSQERVFISAGEYRRDELIGILYKCAGLDLQPLAGGGRLLRAQPEALNRPGPVTGDEARAEMLEMLRPLLLSCDAVPVEPFHDEPPDRRRNLTTRYPGYPTGKIVDLGPFSPEEILSRKRCALKELPPEQRAWVAAAVRHSRAHRVLPEVREVQIVPGLTFTVCLADPGGTRKKIEGRPDIAALLERYPGCMIYGGGGETWVIDAPPPRLGFQVHWR